MIRLQHLDTTSGENVYIVLYNASGDQVFDSESELFIAFNDDDLNPSETFDPNIYGMEMTEDAQRFAWYWLDIDFNFEDGVYRYEVFASEDDEFDRSADALRAIGEFEVSSGAVLTGNDSTTKTIKNNLKDLERAVYALANRAKSGDRRPR